MKQPNVKVSPTPYQEVMAVLTGDTLRAVEEEIARQVGEPIIREYSTSSTGSTQAWMSVSGMSPQEIQNLLADEREKIIEFGIRFLRDDQATSNQQEYPPGEEMEELNSKPISLGLGVGFGITYAIYYRFLREGLRADLRAFLKNRRIPKHAAFARHLERIYKELTHAH